MDTNHSCNYNLKTVFVILKVGFSHSAVQWHGQGTDFIITNLNNQQWCTVPSEDEDYKSSIEKTAIAIQD